MKCNEKNHGKPCNGNMKFAKVLFDYCFQPYGKDGYLIKHSHDAACLVPAYKCEKCGHSITR